MAYEPVARQEAEIAQLEELNRTRALTGAESDRLYQLINRKRIRAYRIDARIRATRAKLAQLEAMAA